MRTCVRGTRRWSRPVPAFVISEVLRVLDEDAAARYRPLAPAAFERRLLVAPGLP
jgi:hypothetical protein